MAGPNVRLTQAAEETLVSGSPSRVRVTQAVRETLETVASTATTNARLTQTAKEVLLFGTPSNVRVTQAVRETLETVAAAPAAAGVYLTQEVLENIHLPSVQQAALTQAVLEFIKFVPNSVDMTQSVLEVVVALAPAPTVTGKYIAMGNSLTYKGRFIV